MSDVDAALHSLLDALVPRAERWRFVRKMLGPERPAPRHLPDGDGWVASIAEVPPCSVFEGLRADWPEALARIDAVEAELVPREERLRRLVPELPIHLCMVGRTALVESLMAHPVMRSGGRLHLHGEPRSGRSLVACQLARLSVDRIPVIGWFDGRCASGLEGGLLEFARRLGFPPAPWETVWAQLTDWFAGHGDWLVVVDDAPDTLPPMFCGMTGVVVTVGSAPLPGEVHNVPLPELQGEARAAVVRRWSRGRLDPAEVPLTASLGRLVQVSAAAGARRIRGVADRTQQEAYAEAEGLAELLGAFAPSAVPLELLHGCEGSPVSELVPPRVSAWLRSPRSVRAAAHELVRLARAHWVGDALLLGDRGAVIPARLPLVVTAAVLVLQALARPSSLPFGWIPHVTALADEPLVPAHLRRALASRAGRLALEAGDPVHAVGWFQRSLAALDTADPSVEAGLLNDLGVAWRRAGRRREAETVLREALARDRGVESPDPLAVASTSANLGHVLRELGQLEEARRLYGFAFDTRRRILGESHVQTGAVAVQIGVLARAQGRLDDARAAWDAAIAGLEQARPIPMLLLADALFHRAQLGVETGECPQLAVQLAERAHRQVSNIHSMDHPSARRIREWLDGRRHGTPRAPSGSTGPEVM